METIDKELDARGLGCPLPIIQASKWLKRLAPGQYLKVLATDPGTVNDMVVLCKTSGNELVESTTLNGDFIYLIKKTAA